MYILYSVCMMCSPLIRTWVVGWVPSVPVMQCLELCLTMCPTPVWSLPGKEFRNYERIHTSQKFVCVCVCVCGSLL